MRRHTPLCKRLAWGMEQQPDSMDPAFSCLELDQAIRSLGLSWREIDPVTLIDVIESVLDTDEPIDEDYYRRALLERLERP